MFADIHRIDSAVFKPQQTASKRRYQGNPRKRRENQPETETERWEESLEDDLTTSTKADECHHTLDIEA
jgi:hypothetical protein